MPKVTCLGSGNAETWFLFLSGVQVLVLALVIVLLRNDTAQVAVNIISYNYVFDGR